MKPFVTLASGLGLIARTDVVSFDLGGIIKTRLHAVCFEG